MDDHDIHEFLDSFWCLYHKRTKNLIDGLSWRQIRSLVPTIIAEEVPYWLVWREGEPEWSDLQKRLSSILGEPVSKLTVAPFETTGQVSQGQAGMSTTGQPQENPRINRRMTKRFNKAVPVVIDSKGQNFFSLTKNISVLGIKLVSDVPAEITGTFKVTLMIKPEPMSLNCQFNRNEAGVSLSQLRILPNDEIRRLAEFLALQD